MLNFKLWVVFPAKLFVGLVLVFVFTFSSGALAECVPANFPNDWLQDQEDAGGHTIARHVGKSNQYLVDRYNNNINIQGASTYATELSARNAIQAALTTKRDDFNHWMINADVGQTKADTVDTGATVGRGIYGTTRPVNAGDIHEQNSVRLVMRKKTDLICYLLTSYPTDP